MKVITKNIKDVDLIKAKLVDEKNLKGEKYWTCGCSNGTNNNKSECEKYFFIKPNVEIATVILMFRRYLSNLKKTVTIDLESFISTFSKVDRKDIIHTLITTISYAESIPFDKKTINPIKRPIFNVLASEKDQAEIKNGQKIADCINFARKMQDTPSDVLTPKAYVNFYKKFVENLPKIKIRVLGKEQMIKRKMNLILGVNKGSNHEPQLLVVEYMNNPDSKDIYAFVGKGITFDSGGINLKPGNHIRHMKLDMSGAAIVTSTIAALAMNKVKTNAVAVAALTENIIGPNAQRPDDIIKSYEGRTVEIDNTDAEGRLVLADALTYAARDIKATKICDAATLTGAILYALGKTYTGVWSTCEDFWSEFESASKRASELIWRMPLHEDYRKLLDSKLADITNCATVPHAGSSNATMFLTEFVCGVPYIHCDIAGTADDDSYLGTGVLLRTFYKLSENQK